MVQGQLSDRTGIQVSNIQAKKTKAHIDVLVCSVPRGIHM